MRQIVPRGSSGAGIVSALAIVFSALPAGADESLKGAACRSVHLAYSAPECIAFYNEITIRDSAPGTYFMVCGWGKGYFGLQELPLGRKVVLFSVWDPGDQNDPATVQEDQQVKVLARDKAVRIGRFGNEGTGGQCFLDYDWKVGETYRCFVTARVDGSRSEYAGHFFIPETNEWKHLVTFSTPTGGERLNGMYSFVEDFRRNRISATQNRRAEFGAGWTRSRDGDWSRIMEARFTADDNPVTNIDAGVAGERFFLSTGGKVQNESVPLNDLIRLPSEPERARPDDLPDVP